MKRASLVTMIAVVLAANCIALVHALRNRLPAPEAELTMTQQELRYYRNRTAEDDSGVSLQLTRRERGNWLDRGKLQALGFDCSVNADSPNAREHYQRQRPRKAFLALRYDPTLMDSQDNPGGTLTIRAETSHLVTIDADIDAGKLRARYPDRGHVVILPAVFAAVLEGPGLMGPGGNPEARHALHVAGVIRQLPSAIHVPRPFSEEFRHQAADSPQSYRVHLRFGASLEPWVTGVEFGN